MKKGRLFALIFPGLILSALGLLVSSCISPSRPVAYGEMARPPFLQQDRQGNLLINLSNSNRHSALSVADVSAEVREAEKVVLIRGTQSLETNPGPVFKLNVPRARIMEYQYYWVDPDGRRHPLAFE